MPVLLLARGDQDAREWLKKAIEARYGNRPPVIETLRINFAGRVQTKVGPISTRVPLDVTAQFSLPSAMRWDFTAKPIGVAIRKGIESYDGSTFRTLRGGNHPTIVEDPTVISSAQKRLWAIAAMLLTPLGDHFVELKRIDELTFSAKNVKINEAVQIHLQPNYQVDQIYVDATNTDTGKVQRFSLRMEPELVSFGDLLFPKMITAYWDDNLWFEMETTQAENNPDLSTDIFTLNAEPHST